MTPSFIHKAEHASRTQVYLPRLSVDETLVQIGRRVPGYIVQEQLQE